MKISRIKTNVRLKLIAAALAVMAAYGSPGAITHQPAHAQEPLIERTIATRLVEDVPAANLRGGPGLEFEVIDTVTGNDFILATGRAKDSNWLRVKVNGQEGWLSGELIRNQNWLPLLNTVATTDLAPAAELEAQAQKPVEGYTGIGAQMDYRDGLPAFSAVFEGYPAHQAGLRADDILLEVDGQDVTYLSIYEIVMIIRGEVGTKVKLTVLRPETDQTLTVSIVRGEVLYNNIDPICKEPIRGFGKVWREHPEIHQILGCPFINFRRNEHATRSAVQTFEHGWMLWLETDTVANVDPIYVFYEDDGTFARYGDRPLADAHAYAPTWSGFHKVGDRFAKVYWEDIGGQGRYRLGYAIDEARDSSGAFQEFENGRMFWSAHADTIYVIYTGFADPDGDGIRTLTNSWLSFEDTFEDAAE